MYKDAKGLVESCDKCQKFAKVSHLSASQQSPIGSPWPFAVWGMDILGPFPHASGQRKFLLVAIDHFTKWIEALAVPTITEEKIEKFFRN